MNSNKSKISCNKGFTLIELLVVVLIIGILAAVALPQYQRAVLKSKYASIKQLAQSVANAEGVYYLSNGVYADSFSKLDIQTSGTKLEIPKINDIESYQIDDEIFCGIESSMIHCFFLPRYMDYQIFYPHTDNTFKGKKRCIAEKEDSIANKICQQETGKGSADCRGSVCRWEY